MTIMPSWFWNRFDIFIGLLNLGVAIGYIVRVMMGESVHLGLLIFIPVHLLLGTYLITKAYERWQS
jgi:hypothetical protein